MKKIVVLILLFSCCCQQQELKLVLENPFSITTQHTTSEYNGVKCDFYHGFNKKGDLVGKLIVDPSKDTLYFLDKSDEYVELQMFYDDKKIKKIQSVKIEDQYKLNIWRYFDENLKLDDITSSYISVERSNGYKCCLHDMQLDSAIFFEVEKWPNIFELNELEPTDMVIISDNCFFLRENVNDDFKAVVIMYYMEENEDGSRVQTVRPLYLNRTILENNLVVANR